MPQEYDPLSSHANEIQPKRKWNISPVLDQDWNNAQFDIIGC